MRTWKQGRIGKITFPDSSHLFMKCLRYPLAQFYKRINTKTQSLEELLFEVMVQKSVLKYVEILGQEKLRKEDFDKHAKYEEGSRTEDGNNEKQVKYFKGKEIEEVLDIGQILEMYRLIWTI